METKGEKLRHVDGGRKLRDAHIRRFSLNMSRKQVVLPRAL